MSSSQQVYGNFVAQSQAVIEGNLKTLTRISLPIMLFLFCEALTLFFERIFLSYHSMNAVHASLNAGYLATIFQSPCVAIAAMAQVFVGLYQGSNEYKRIGPCVWQLIWFSFLSSPLVLVLSFIASSLYFSNTVIQTIGTQYFTVLAFGNFLFPLQIALASFYLGRGKTFFVTSVMLASYALDLFLNWLLIFGVEGVIAPMGARGAALAKCISLAAVCCIFFISFLNRKNQELYNSRSWHFSPVALWGFMRLGMVRAFGYFSSKICWVAISYIIIRKGSFYLEVLTVGGTVITFLLFITTGMYKAVLTIAPNLIGAGKFDQIWKLCRVTTLYILAISVVLTIPLVFFPDTLICFFDASSKDIFRRTFKDINYWIWLYMVILTIQTSFCAILIALRDLKVQLYCYLFLWPVSFIPVYFGIGVRGWQADKLWLIMLIENITFMFFFFFRLWQRKEGSKQLLLS